MQTPIHFDWFTVRAVVSDGLLLYLVLDIFCLFVSNAYRDRDDGDDNDALRFPVVHDSK